MEYSKLLLATMMSVIVASFALLARGRYTLWFKLIVIVCSLLAGFHSGPMMMMQGVNHADG